MDFLKTDEGRLHGTRLAGILYIAALALDYRDSQLRILMDVLFAVGWWLAFCSKRPTYSFSELLKPVRLAGSVLCLIGLAGKFYLIGR